MAISSVTWSDDVATAVVAVDDDGASAAASCEEEAGEDPTWLVEAGGGWPFLKISFSYYCSTIRHSIFLTTMKN